MTTLPEILPEQTKTVAAIYAHYKRTGDAEPQRGYLGASIIGHPCVRFLWFQFRNCVKRDFDGRMYRLFSTGDHEETRFTADLRAIGCEVHSGSPEGEQFAVEAFGGHFSGHLDGCALGIPDAPKTWHVLEMKTHNAKSFARLKKEGVKVAKPEHYAQMMSYMHLTEMTRALYLAVNKDDDSLIAERIHYNSEEAEALMARAKRIITAQSPPERISETSDYYQCRWCDAQDICWGLSGPNGALPVPSLSCRQCCHATPMLDGVGGAWRCDKHHRGLGPADQSKPCDDHLTLPGLLAFADPVDYGKDDEGNDFIQFQNRDGTKWPHGRREGCYNSRELMTLSPDLLVDKFVAGAKELFAGKAVGVQTDILNQHPGCTSVTRWTGLTGRLVDAWKELYAEDLLSLPPVVRCNVFDHSAAEYSGARFAIVWTHPIKKAEIREEVPF